jgi:hypothetical protein
MRYRPRPSGYWDDEYPFLPDLKVDEVLPEDTGLLDQWGQKLMREPNPIGFHARIDD